MMRPQLAPFARDAISAVHAPELDVEIPKPARDVSLTTILLEAVKAVCGDKAMEGTTRGARGTTLALGHRERPALRGQPSIARDAWFRLNPPPPGGYGVPELELMKWFCPWCDREIKVHALIEKRSDLGIAILDHCARAHPEMGDEL